MSGSSFAMKVLEVNDVSSTAEMFTRGLRLLGHHAELYQPTIGTYRRRLVFRALIPPIRTVEALKMRRDFVREGFDRLHIHYETFGYMGIVARLPYYLHCHGGMVTHRHKPVSWRLIRLSLTSARRVFYATPNLCQLIIPIRRDAVFVPNPVDTDFFSPGSGGQNNGRIRILCISKMDTTKGWDFLETVVARLLEHHKRPEVIAFGFGTEHERVIRKRVSYLKHLGVTFVPRLNRVEMRQMLRSVDIVLGQLATGAMGMSELEALACGRVVCCRFDYDQFYPEKPPILKAHSYEEAIRMVEGVMDSPKQLDELGARGREWVVAHHALEVSASKLVEEMSA